MVHKIGQLIRKPTIAMFVLCGAGSFISGKCTMEDGIPERPKILSGMYALTIGTHQMRSRIQLPGKIPACPKILGEAGYYCTNNSKKDYNSNDESGPHLWPERKKIY